jgi:hypothetical protein
VSTAAFAPLTQELAFGRYRPLRPLGSGGSGSVWLARDERNGLDVALKIIPREGKAAARAEREAIAARRLRHDRCVRAYDVGHDTGHVYIAYEYVPGRTVREALRADLLTDEDAAEVAAQVLDALAHAHRAGIVHRDVKPSNILFEDGDDVSVRLLDFGLAQFDGADTLTAVGDVPGTLAYIAPERLAGEDASAASDVWSVGVLLWEALAGRHPFWGVPLQDVARAIETGAPPLVSERRDLPRRLLSAVDTALSPEPDARPRASALAADLRAAFKAPDRDRRPARRPSDATARSQVPALALGERLLPVALAVAGAALGATLLPFWPPLLVAAIVLGAGLAAWVDPRAGLAVAVAAPIFPFGNVAEGAALAYGVVALGLLALGWRDARGGLLFLTGPLLHPLGLLALVPLLVQPARGTARRAAQGVLAVLAATLTAGIAGASVPFGSTTVALDVAPADGALEVALAAWQLLLSTPAVLVGAALVGLVAGMLPWARARSRYGVAGCGAVMAIATIAAGAGVPATLGVLLGWGIAALLALRVSR